MDELISEIEDDVQIIRVDRVEAQNALSDDICEATADALSFGEGSSRVRSILLTGVPGLFSIGQGPAELARAADIGNLGEGVIRLFKTIATIDKPVVAAIDGVATGSAVTLLFHCDYVVASEWASLSAPFAVMGLPPEGGLSLIAPRQIGYQNAFGLLVMGDTLDANEARRAGIVNRVVAPEDVERVGTAAASRLASLPPEAIRIARRMMRGERRDVVARIDQEANAFTDLLRSPAAVDALDAYLGRQR